MEGNELVAIQIAEVAAIEGLAAKARRSLVLPAKAERFRMHLLTANRNAARHTPGGVFLWVAVYSALSSISAP